MSIRKKRNVDFQATLGKIKNTEPGTHNRFIQITQYNESNAKKTEAPGWCQSTVK